MLAQTRVALWAVLKYGWNDNLSLNKCLTQRLNDSAYSLFLKRNVNGASGSQNEDWYKVLDNLYDGIKSSC